MNKPKESTVDQRQEVIAEVLELFEGDQSGAEDWLHTPIRGLGYKRPAEMIRTAQGVEQVRMLIGRLEHGVFT